MPKSVDDLVRYMIDNDIDPNNTEMQVLVDDGERLYRKVAGIYYDEAYDALIIDCADTRVAPLNKPREIPRA